MADSIEQKLANGVFALKEAYDLLLEKNAELETKIETFEKRALAEDLLVKARNTNTNLRANDLDEFLAKRAQLEEEEVERLVKIAASLELINDEGDIEIGDMGNGHTIGSSDDFVEFVMNHSTVV